MKLRALAVWRGDEEFWIWHPNPNPNPKPEGSTAILRAGNEWGSIFTHDVEEGVDQARSVGESIAEVVALEKSRNKIIEERPGWNNEDLGSKVLTQCNNLERISLINYFNDINMAD